MRKKIIVFSTCIFEVILIVLSVLFINKIIKVNPLIAKMYPVWGVDVSSHQGKIDWEILKTQGVRFAFIKATEGSNFVDKNFIYNLDGAIKNNINTGAYHFFSFDSSGETQANNFMRIVPRLKNMLPPVIDVEFYNDKAKNPPDKAYVKENLTKLLQKLEKHYGVKPIIYTTQKVYKRYILKDFDEYDLWIRDVFLIPVLQDGRQWRFWQFSDTAKLSGYNGTETNIDLNVYNGSEADFESYIKSLRER